MLNNGKIITVVQIKTSPVQIHRFCNPTVAVEARDANNKAA